MTHALALPLTPHASFSSSSLILAATRSWRRARDSGRPVQPALFETLDGLRLGILAPVFAGLIGAYEACVGRPIRVGGPSPADPSPDESRLLALLEDPGEGEAANAADPSLCGTLPVALRSTRIMMRLAIESRSETPAAPAFRPIKRGVGMRTRLSGLGLRRNRPAATLIERLRETYSVTAQILGKSRFKTAARAYAGRKGNHDAGADGLGFAAFLADHFQAGDIPYLADVAMLERLRAEARLAADAPALAIQDLPQAGEEGWASLSLTLHPATGIAWLSTPAVTIWQSHHAGQIAGSPEWQAEGALVTRRADEVALHAIDRPEHRLLSGLRLREPFGKAAAATRKLYPEADVGVILAGLVERGAFAR